MEVSPDELPAYEFIADCSCKIDQSGKYPRGRRANRNRFRTRWLSRGIEFCYWGDVCDVPGFRCLCFAHWRSYGCCRLRLLQK